MTKTYTGPHAALACVVLLAFIVLFVAGLGAIFAFLWNAFLPGAVGVSAISNGQGVMAVLLLMLIGSFFKR